MLKIMAEGTASDLPDHTTHLRLYFKMQISSLHLGPGKSLPLESGPRASSHSITWELLRNSPEQPQPECTRVCTPTRSPGDLYAH